MLMFLKLGGSLITNKDIPFLARKEKIKCLGVEIKKSIDTFPELSLLIGHGSGSFGHSAAAQFGTRSGIRSKEDWLGFQKVWLAAHQFSISGYLSFLYQFQHLLFPKTIRFTSGMSNQLFPAWKTTFCQLYLEMWLSIEN